MNVPIGAAVLLLAPRIVPESRGEGVCGGYDVEGAAAVTLGTMALVFTLIKANDWAGGRRRPSPASRWPPCCSAASSGSSAGTRTPWSRCASSPTRSLAASDATMLLLAAALFGVFYFCSLYLQQVLGYNALKTGVAYLPLSLSIIASSTVASRVVDRFEPVLVSAGCSSRRWASRCSPALQAHADYAGHLLPAMIVMGVGLGMSFVPITIAATNGVAREDSASPRACSTRPNRSAGRWASPSSRPSRRRGSRARSTADRRGPRR